MTRPLWIFGYGSLVWRPDMPFDDRRAGFVRGWARRFWQGSPDHRGVPEAPGRVVTLVREAAAECWGVAYRIPASETERVLRELDHREKAGYERVVESFHANGDDVEALFYVADEHNPNYLGPAPLEEIARHARASCGPSGSNVEYVLELAAALRELGADDPHVFAVAELLR